MLYRISNSFQARLNKISSLLEKKKGCGAGKGGGAGGSIRESGGSLGQYGTAQEEQFFFNKQREQLEKLKKKLKESKVGDLTQKKEKQEQVDTVKMPGFVDPQTMHEEGYFTQKAKQQIEELKKRLDKPKAESGEKKE